MAVSLSASGTGHLSAGASSLSSSFLPQSKRLVNSFNPSSSARSISGGSVLSSPTGGFRSARCRTMSAELEGPVAPKSFYELLGLEQGVGLFDIKSSYRKLARRYHPDVCPAEDREECTRMFLQVQDAYEVLSDPEQRAKYDYQMMNPLSPGAVGWGSVVRRCKESDLDTAAWRSAWQEQLARFPKKQRQADSWGARMRAKQGRS